VVLCDCDNHCSGQRRHAVALIDDARPDGRLMVEPEYFPGVNVGPGGSVGGRLVNPNTRGDYDTPYNVRCPCCGKGQPVLQSTIGAALQTLTEWIANYAERMSTTDTVPASDEDASLHSARAVADMLGD
jgi:hypothetical protein